MLTQLRSAFHGFQALEMGLHWKIVEAVKHRQAVRMSIMSVQHDLANQRRSTKIRRYRKRMETFVQLMHNL
jgi:hypothetical protein